MNEKTELLTSAEIAYKLQRIYADNFFRTPGYLSAINRFRSEMINYFQDEEDLLCQCIPKVAAFVDISSTYINKQKIKLLIEITEGWTLLAFDKYINNSIQVLSGIKRNEKIEVSKADKPFFKRFARFSSYDISSLFPPCS